MSPALSSVVQTWPQCPGRLLPAPWPTLCTLTRKTLSTMLAVGAIQLPVSWVSCVAERFTTWLWRLRTQPVTAPEASKQPSWQVEKRQRLKKNYIFASLETHFDPSPFHFLPSAPCSPSIQNSNLICGTNSSSLSWTLMADATGYVVNATATNGHTVSCTSASATCNLTDLLCSETYMTTITARGRECDSAPSSSTNITTTPCSPTIMSKQYTCETNTAVFSWTEPLGRLGFLAQVAGVGYQDSCQTTNTSCAFQNLPCGLDLHLTVEAQGAKCNSTPSVSKSLQTGNSFHHFTTCTFSYCSLIYQLVNNHVRHVSAL